MVFHTRPSLTGAFVGSSVYYDARLSVGFHTAIKSLVEGSLPRLIGIIGGPIRDYYTPFRPYWSG